VAAKEKTLTIPREVEYRGRDCKKRLKQSLKNEWRDINE
jgi:hypothetical protein